MAKVLAAFIYMVAILVIGFVSAKRIKTAESLAMAGEKIPFWANAYSMVSVQIGAGATMGIASITYMYGFSSMILGFGAATGAIRSRLIFAKKIKGTNVATIPELIRNYLGERVANAICILTTTRVFGILAGQVRSLGTILQILIPSLSLLNVIIIMSAVTMIYSIVDGIVAATSTDKLNVSVMIIPVMAIAPTIAMMEIGDTHGLTLSLSVDQKSLAIMGIVPMISTFLYFGLADMINSKNFLRIYGAKNVHEVKGAILTAALLIHFPYMIFAGLIGIMGTPSIPELGVSDSIIPAMIDRTTGDLTGAFFLSGLLVAVMGIAVSVAIAINVTFTRDVAVYLKRDMSGSGMSKIQRISLIVFIILAVIVGYQGTSVATTMEDVGAPCVAALIPIFLEMSSWEKTNPRGATITIAAAMIPMVGYRLMDSPLGTNHLLFGLAYSIITLLVACPLTYRGKDDKQEIR